MGEMVINPGAIDDLYDRSDKGKYYRYLSISPATVTRIKSWAGFYVLLCGSMLVTTISFTIKNGSAQSNAYETLGEINLSDYIYDDEEIASSAASINTVGSSSGTVGGNVYVVGADFNTSTNKCVFKLFQYGTAAKDDIVRCQLVFPFKKKKTTT